MNTATLSSPAIAYRRLAVETGVSDASPHRLIGMLLDGALECIARARAARARRDLAARSHAVSRAARIVEEGLRASLDPAGGEIAVNLDQLYAYITLRLSEANATGDDDLLDEVEKLLRTIHDGWQGIAGDGRSRG